jgi:aminoglycoside 6'-N-acetyltransferase
MEMTALERVPRESLVGGVSVVRPATRDDVDRLVAWHADPEVSRYWDDEVPSREDIVADLARPDVDAYIVEADGEPVGYLQAWFDPDEAGLDMILVPSARDRGIGPDAARTLATWLVDHGHVGRLIVDPYTWNARAIAAWTKAGFRAVGEREPDAERRDRWLLMEFER